LLYILVKCAVGAEIAQHLAFALNALVMNIPKDADALWRPRRPADHLSTAQRRA
jgi:hypothetical protein